MDKQLNNVQAENDQVLFEQKKIKKQSDELAKQKLELIEGEKEVERQFEFVKLREQAAIKKEEDHNTRSLELETRHQQQEIRQLEIKQGLPALRDKIFAEREHQLEKLKQQYEQQLKDITDQREQLSLESERIAKAEQGVKSNFTEQRANLQKELQQKRSEALSELDQEIQEQREKSFNTLEAEIQQRRDNLDKRQENLDKKQAQLIADQNDVKLDRVQIDALQASFEQKIAESIQTRLQEFEQNEIQFELDKKRLLSRIKHQDELHSAYDELKKLLGDRSAVEVLHDLTTKNEELKLLREELNRLSQKPEEYYDNHRAEIAQIENDKQQLQNEIRELQRDLDAQEQLEHDQERLQTKFNSLEVRYEAVKADNNKLAETLKRVSPSYKDPADIKERLKNIKRPYIENFVPRRQEKYIRELDWLETISSKIDDYGLHFSNRILCAFHTALKIAEWSPLTVLAGVSGTGKSELPKLYSRFGGINFINVPVQPNWDSQESMLGYFNSINNSYEAQPMLNFLVQSREQPVTDSENSEDNYNGLNDTVSLVLLDEMNLAHVELYFADFLSKLEQRRGAKNNELPHIDINMGSNLDPYKLSLGRNLLFAGTMNQDETTKSLSDKVIDRGTSIYFPRPTSLHRREGLKALPQQVNLLPMTIWWQWINKKSNLSTEIVKPYKQIIENINNCLGADGKALGHRVWQSIEYYMVNHPLVIGLDAQQYPDEYKEALKFAFEDQLVQKVMPKLRGIETRGYAKQHCLDPIREILAKEKLDILDDFDKAMRIGHGQFNWVSADYLNNEQSNERYQELFKLATTVVLSDQKTNVQQELAQGV